MDRDLARQILIALALFLMRILLETAEKRYLAVKGASETGGRLPVSEDATCPLTDEQSDRGKHP